MFCQQVYKANISIEAGKSIIIDRNIYGQFSEHLGRCIYDGIYQEGKIRKDIVTALKKISVPVLRWPGGCFADQYHWREGIGTKTNRSATINTNWGMVKEDNSFGTNEFLKLCELIGCEPYLAGNVGTGSSQEMKDWIEYLNGPLRGGTVMTKLRAANGHPEPYNISFIGVGNESWDCGGNMTPEFYSNQYKQFASFLPDYPGTHLRKIASGAYKDDYNWTDVCMKNIGTDKLWGISLHYYIFTDGFNNKGSATEITQEQYFKSLKKTLWMDSLIAGHSAIMDKYDPDKKVALVVDEWGIWTDPTPGTNPDFLEQQNSFRDALIAATTLNIFNNHCDRVKLACVAQMVNVLQSLILTKGNQMLLTPTYHVFDLYKVHQNAKLLPVKIESAYYRNGKDSIAAVNVSASKDSNNIVHISLVNIDPSNKIIVDINLNETLWKTIAGKVLTAERFNGINTFEKPNTIVPQQFKAFKKQENRLVVELPAKSIVVLELR